MQRKILQVPDTGFSMEGVSMRDEFPVLFPHQLDVVKWALEGGNRAIFCSFGLGKTIMQLSIAHYVVGFTDRAFIIGLPLGPLGEFMEDAELLGYKVKYVTDQSQISEPGIYLSNYERIRNRNFNPASFAGCSFDEGDAIRNLDTCESYHDMGHNDGNDAFFEQLSFLTAELLRILKPGRICAVHVKDRIRFSYQNGAGFSSMSDFSRDTSLHFEKHGFHILGKHFITTDVVRENNQTYRLGWTENCKDGTKMGCGLGEYLYIFRKTPSDISNAYADVPVLKSKQDYTRGRWQLDAHQYWRSSGQRLLDSDELKKMDLSHVGKAWETLSKEEVYNYKKHVAICEALDELGKLPADFMAVPTHSVDDVVWDDVSRMHTLNSSQTRKRQEKHTCPFQFDIVDRAIARYSNAGETIYDPFGGLMTVPYRCIKLGRVGIATELNPVSFKDGVNYCKSEEYKITVPTLFDELKEVVNY